MLHAQLVRTGQALQIPVELRTLAFIPTACSLALVLADVWRRPTGRAALELAFNALLLHVFLLASLLVPLCLFFAEPEPIGAVAARSATAPHAAPRRNEARYGPNVNSSGRTLRAA